jgi:hypothetical protein
MTLTELFNELSEKEIIEKIDNNVIYYPDDFPLDFLRIRGIFNYYDERKKEFPLVLKKTERIERLGYGAYRIFSRLTPNSYLVALIIIEPNRDWGRVRIVDLYKRDFRTGTRIDCQRISI